MQAEKQLPAGWKLMRDGTLACPEIPDWLIEALPEGAVVGVDPFLHTVAIPFAVEQSILHPFTIAGDVDAYHLLRVACHQEQSASHQLLILLALM